MKLSKWLTTFMLVCSSVTWAKVNINTASISELESLKGIGTQKAKKIIECRNKVGSFKSIEELIKVSGVGPATLDKIRGEIEVSDNSIFSASKSDHNNEKTGKMEVEIPSEIEQKDNKNKNSSQSESKEEKDKSSTK